MRLFIQPFLSAGVLQMCAELHKRENRGMDELLSMDELTI